MTLVRSTTLGKHSNTTWSSFCKTIRRIYSFFSPFSTARCSSCQNGNGKTSNFEDQIGWCWLLISTMGRQKQWWSEEGNLPLQMGGRGSRALNVLDPPFYYFALSSARVQVQLHCTASEESLFLLLIGASLMSAACQQLWMGCTSAPPNPNPQMWCFHFWRHYWPDSSEITISRCMGGKGCHCQKLQARD